MSLANYKPVVLKHGLNRVEFSGTRVEIPDGLPLYYMIPVGNIEQIKASIYDTLTSSYQLTQQQIEAIRPIVANSNVANQLMADALNVKLEQLG